MGITLKCILERCLSWFEIACGSLKYTASAVKTGVQANVQLQSLAQLLPCGSAVLWKPLNFSVWKTDSSISVLTWDTCFDSFRMPIA